MRACVCAPPLQVIVLDGGKLSHMGRYTELVAKGVNFTSLSGATPGESESAHTHTSSKAKPPTP